MTLRTVQGPSQMVRIAHAIRQQLLALRKRRFIEVSGQSGQLLEKLAAIQHRRRRLDVCLRRGWHSAAENTLAQLASTTADLPYHVGQVSRTVHEAQTGVPKLRDVVGELEQLADEFGHIRWCDAKHILAVATEPVELDGIYLGPFEIRLHVDRLSDIPSACPYTIVALDPHPAASNPAVTHPHVSDEGLCAGDAGAAISLALANGRVGDFALLVNSVLAEYNPSSPYVCLDVWLGTACRDCGYVASGDDIFWCSTCEDDYCSDCISSCQRCDETTCRSCLQRCPVCSDSFCRLCMTECELCGRTLCKSCADDEACPCREEQGKDDHDKTGSS